MFLIHSNKDLCRNSLNKLISQLEGIQCGPIQQINIENYWLSWSHCKPSANLHVFDDGILLGKLSFMEESCESIIAHEECLPTQFHPLALGSCIRRKDSKILIEPLNVTNIYYGLDSVSDMQLLIADAEGHLPSPELVGVLATVGYFPGNLTLFEEIKRIPFLVSYDLSSHQLTDIPSIVFNKPDDSLLIERLESIVPDHPLQYIAMSGGYDSRFVLGILRQQNVIPNLIHICGEETELVLRIAKQLGYPYTFFKASETSYLSPKVYTLATDAQIYFRGGNYSCVRDVIARDSLFYTGNFSPSMNKNTFRAVLTTPGTTKNNIYNRLVEHLFIRINEGMVFGLRDIKSLGQIKKYLLEELKFVNDYSKFRNRKEYANWFYYLLFGTRWCYHNVADISYFTQPIFLFSDFEALMYGISSDEWANYKHDRVRNMNAKLLPELTVPYSDGGNYVENNSLKNDLQKINFEYLNKIKNPVRLISRIFNPQKISPPSQNIIFSFENVDFYANEFTRYFIDDYHRIMQKPTYPYWLKRAAVTVGYALQFLGK